MLTPAKESRESNLPSKKIKFSIITATFNSGMLFDRTADSLRAQTFKYFEWIVMDGGSTDDTVARITAATDIVTVWSSEPDRGISDAWNKALSKVRGEYVLFLNAGDTYDEGFLDSVQKHCDGKRVVCSHARILTEDGRNIGIFRSEPAKLFRAMHVAHNWCAVPAIHYLNLGGYAEIPLAMDFEWFYKYYQIYGVDGFVVLDHSLGSYYLGGKSDKNFISSFCANESIIIANGGNPILARIYRYEYIMKHALSRLLLWR